MKDKELRDKVNRDCYLSTRREMFEDKKLVPVNEVVKMILNHFGLDIEYHPATSSSFSLRVRDPFKRENE